MSLLRNFDLFANPHPQLALWETNIATRCAGFASRRSRRHISSLQRQLWVTQSKNARAREGGRHNSWYVVLCRSSGASIHSLMLTHSWRCGLRLSSPAARVSPVGEADAISVARRHLISPRRQLWVNDLTWMGAV